MRDSEITTFAKLPNVTANGKGRLCWLANDEEKFKPIDTFNSFTVDRKTGVTQPDPEKVLIFAPPHPNKRKENNQPVIYLSRFLPSHHLVHM